MQDFLFKEIISSNIENELLNVGFDNSYISKAKDKFNYKTFKIFNLTVAQANILKQTALSFGCDCATNRNVITGEIKTSDVILTGSISQLKKISQKLKLQPFSLKNLAKNLDELLNQETPRKKTKIMGILNLTQNSFSDGGYYYEYENAIKHLGSLIQEGADIIDIGAESTRPGADEIPADKQLEKIIPVLDYINKNNIRIPISIDTRSSIVADECLKKGVSIINDVSGLEFDPKITDIVAKYPKTKLIIQHAKGIPSNMQNNPHYENLMDEIYLFLDKKIKQSVETGIEKSNIIVDPGIGFGKTRQDNFEIINRWQELKNLDCEIMLGISRKSLLNMLDSSNEEKDIYTLSINSKLMFENIDYIRVHNVKLHKKFQENILLNKR